MRTTELIRLAQRALLLLTALFLFASAALAQTTEFTYQGKLSDGGAPANGSYDLELRLFDVPAGGAALGTQQKPAVVATAGIFTVQLDFGLSVFAGPPRYLEISVRPAGSPDPYTILSPRQPVSSTPYAVRSLNASVADTLSSACVGCVTSTQIGSVSASTITGTIPSGSLPADSGAYVQNTSSTQAGSNFNISGTGSANVFNAETQYNIGGTRVLSLAITTGVFAGRLAGAANTTGSGNSFFGDSAGRSNTSAGNNSFFGRDAGAVNTAGENSFFGAFAGSSNTTGTRNSFFGRTAGDANQVGDDDSFFGYRAGRLSTANGNSFFGAGTGQNTTTGEKNAFFGWNAGATNTTGHRNAFFGPDAGFSNETGQENAYFGNAAGYNSNGSYNAFFGMTAGYFNTTGSGNAFFGHNAGVSNKTGSNNAYFGDGAGNHNRESSSNSFFGYQAGFDNEDTQNSFFGSLAGSFHRIGYGNTFIGTSAGAGHTTNTRNTFIGYDANGANDLTFATAIGSGAVVTTSNTVVLGRTADNVTVPGNLFVKSIGGGGNLSVCRNPAGKIANCSSSLRYKTAVQSFLGGLAIVRRLRPITFNWKDSGMHDVGFGAEEVARVEPLLTTRNDQGEIEGVKYAQITTVLVNAVKEQQAQIEQQHRLNKELQVQLKQAQLQIDALKKLVCLSHRATNLCKR